MNVSALATTVSLSTPVQPALNGRAAPPGTGAPPPAASLADVPIYRGNAARTGEMPGPGPAEEPGLRWQALAPTDGAAPIDPAAPAIYLSPVVNDGLAFLSYPGGLDSIDIATGSARWRYASGDGVRHATPTVDGDSVYLASLDGRLYAIDATNGAEPTDPAGNVLATSTGTMRATRIVAEAPGTPAAGTPTG